MMAQPTIHTAPARRRLRVTTGCRTCRRRHVKCDEGKPTCANCGKKNRPCRYDGDTETTEPEEEGQTSPIAARAAHLSSSPESGFAAARHGEERYLNVHEAIASSEQPREPIQLIDPPPFSAHSPVSPFSATLESILLQAGIETGASRYPGLSVSETVPPDLHVPSYIDPGFGQFVDPRAASETANASDDRLRLSDSEISIFRNYVENVSKWIDSFSHDQPFHRLVPVLALRCPFLLHSCLALSSKQMVLTAMGIHESTALRYYRLALKAVSTLLVHPVYAHSDEVLAACIILSTYEMIDVVGESLGSHLKGVASLLQTRQIYGNVSGIRGACYWTWYRHEIWASLQTGRRMSLDENYWKPQDLDSFEDLTIESIANRVIFLFAQCINFCNEGAGSSMEARHSRASELGQALDAWTSKLPASMSAFAVGDPTADTSVFPSLWFIYPQSAIAHQVYHASRIILALHRPPPSPEARGLGNLASLSLRRHIETSREQIFLTANAGIPDAWSLVSSECLYIAGLVTEGVQERKRTLELISECQQRSGRRTSFIADELRRCWSYNKVTTLPF